MSAYRREKHVNLNLYPVFFYIFFTQTLGLMYPFQNLFHYFCKINSFGKKTS